MRRGGAALWFFALATTGTALGQDGEAQAGDATLLATQPAWGARDEEARVLFDAGVIAYQGGHFGDAQASFQRSYDLSGRPALLHNVATAAERANHDRDALRAYREYLRLEPDTPRRARVEVRIQALEALLADGTADATPHSSEGAGEQSVAPWILLAAGGAVTIAGLVMVGVAAADVASVEGSERGSRWSEYEASYNRSEPLSVAGFVALGVGVAAATAGLAWAIVDGDSSDSASLRLDLQPTGLALSGTMP